MTDARSRIGKSSKAKGAAAELEVRNLVQAWWRQLEPECVFARTPSSGGWSAPSMRGEFKVAGDLTTTAQHWPFTVEVKRREGWSERELKAGRRSPVWSWWGQVMVASEEEGRTPMLWFRRSHTPWLVMLPQSYVNAIAPAFPIVCCWSIQAFNFTVHPIVVRATDVLAFDPRTFAT